ncbi:ornithine carbamoyltransferase [soil metagenome]
MRHFLDIDATPAPELRAMIEAARAMKAARGGMAKGRPDAEAPLAGHLVALIFEKPSTRTRASFDAGVRQLGGQTMVLTGAEMQLGHGETIADTARVLSGYVDLIMIRTFEEATLRELAEHARVPVINGLTNRSHPCQIMADVMTYEEQRGPIAGAKVVWSGDGNNVCASWLHAAGRFGFDLTFTGPEPLDPGPEAVAFARQAGARVTIERDAARAVAGADLVLTDTWLSMHDPQSARERRHNMLRPYQVDAGLMAEAKPTALFMHCLPAHRGEEVSSAVMDGAQSVVFDEAENWLHAQKAILRWCLGR